MNFNLAYICKNNMGLFSRDKYDSTNWFIPLSMIPLSGAYCTKVMILKKFLKKITKLVSPGLIWKPLRNVIGKLLLLVTVPMNPRLSVSIELIEDKSLWESKTMVSPLLIPEWVDIIYGSLTQTLTDKKIDGLWVLLTALIVNKKITSLGLWTWYSPQIDL